MSTLKWGLRSSSAIIGAFLQTVFLFFLWSNNKMFLNSKKSKSFRRLRLTRLLLKEILWKHPCMDFAKTNIVSCVQL